jgi:hypothetical protein
MNEEGNGRGAALCFRQARQQPPNRQRPSAGPGHETVLPDEAPDTHGLHPLHFLSSFMRCARASRMSEISK